MELPPPVIRLKTRQMYLLLALDRARNMHQAAAATNMSQPAASKMLKDIEDLYGVPMFERLPRGIRPTLYGETLIAHVRMAMSNLSQANDSIATLQAGLSGQVNIGAIITPCMSLVPQAIARTKDEAPRLCIGIEIGTSNVLVERLKRGELDLVIGRILEQNDESSLHYEDLSEEADCVVARVDHPLLARDDIKLEDLSAAGWILSGTGTVLRHQFDMVFRRAGIELPVNVVETTAIPVITSLLQQTDFLHLMPVEVARYYAQSGELTILPIALPFRMSSFGIILRRSELLSAGVRIFLRHLQAVAAEIYWVPLADKVSR
jgi:DNA-binding transcriptional LysR family regulator